MTNKIIRRCIICGSDHHVPKFTYTWDFLTKVRWSPPDELRLYGWDENSTSTVVECSDCGCFYTRDVIAYPEAASVNELVTDHGGGDSSIENPRLYSRIDAAAWTIRNLIVLAAAGKTRGIKFMDFGAGNGTLCNIARALGVGTVVAYDPFSPPGEQAYRDRNFPGILHTRGLEKATAFGPFDAVACQSVIEHVLDPRETLATIYRLMAPGAYLYINNPYMPLDRELPALQAATKISKRDIISYYHQHHFNYMKPAHFERLAKEVGFTLTPMTYFPPVPFAPGMRMRCTIQHLKSLYRGLQHRLGINYGRQFYILRRE
ncbi:MAG: class I SAM-dependent methyltransferase [Ferrovibrio sp.]|uniref:class I SAM-dependent methyltransferase n=1 Tax=Ferrovibrio sp. TaxID=1917215 RepID=UPI00260A2173|nr:class I SAM-dependent methyltransferase [Ferrovibrio sp.]MCW0234919.1 class I SAM-dependent methyltransferase [Ferrovibrio sp.]